MRHHSEAGLPSYLQLCSVSYSGASEKCTRTVLIIARGQRSALLSYAGMMVWSAGLGYIKYQVGYT
jgi:hypothetical protein